MAALRTELRRGVESPTNERVTTTGGGMSSSVTVATPLGDIILVASPAGLQRAYLPGLAHERVITEARTGGAAILNVAATQLREYFRGERWEFTVPLDLEPRGFQAKVQLALPTVAAGHTSTYGRLAQQLGYPGAARAVGTACATNPLALFLPCHRVVKADGSIGQYAGGVAMKRWLLEHEKAALVAGSYKLNQR